MRSRHYSIELPLSFDEDLEPVAERLRLSKTVVLQYIVAWWCEHPEFHDDFERRVNDVFPSD